jgi:hypothetical protein
LLKEALVTIMPGRDGGAASIRKGGEVDEWGLPVKSKEVEVPAKGEEVTTTEGGEEGQERDTKSSTHKTTADKDVPREKTKDTEDTNIHIKAGDKEIPKETTETTTKGKKVVAEDSSSDDDEFKDAPSEQIPEAAEVTEATKVPKSTETPGAPVITEESSPEATKDKHTKTEGPATKSPTTEASTAEAPATEAATKAAQVAAEPAEKQGHTRAKSSVNSISKAGHKRGKSSVNRVSEWSHQQTAVQPEEEDKKEDSEDEWQTMPAYAPFDMYDDDNKLVAKEAQDSDVEDATYAGLGGAGKGYTRVQLDEDAQSATSMDEHTSYLFKEVNGDTTAAGFEDEEQRDAVSQMETTKDLLTEGQRIAYVGMTRLVLTSMVKAHEAIEGTSKGAKKETSVGTAAMRMFSQKMMIRLYAHMEISTPEQIMIEQLSEHGVEPRDLTPTLMANARVKNPMAEKAESVGGKTDSPRPGSMAGDKSSEKAGEKSAKGSMSSSQIEEEEAAAPPPPYVETDGEHLPEVRTPGQLPTTKNLDIDLRWTVLCDLFLTLVADSVYDARSRVLLEQVGSHLDVTWLDICRFEKRVTDALEMQQAAEKENWNEDEHKESRRKMALKKRYMMMGLATVGGGLVIGLSAGLLAPVIGAGLAAGFTTIGVAGTGGFLAGAGGAAIITSAAATSGGIIAVKAANRRTGAVKTFEYRPLHNNKRVNLIVTVSGWMTGKVDDVRLPYSTVDPIMGDIYSVLWEPEMLTSMGDTINILATEVCSMHSYIKLEARLTDTGINARSSTSPWKHNPHRSHGRSPTPRRPH